MGNKDGFMPFSMEFELGSPISINLRISDQDDLKIGPKPVLVPRDRFCTLILAQEPHKDGSTLGHTNSTLIINKSKNPLTKSFLMGTILLIKNVFILNKKIFIFQYNHSLSVI